ncbi:putative signaling protein [Methylophilaceae bacterium]|nr:putative signaling protein [Methylophilaceae bacterium]
MLRSYFEKLAIQQKLYLMHLLVTGSAMLLVFVAVVAYQAMSFKRDLIHDLESQISVIENNIGAAIAFEDHMAANETLNSLSLNKSVERAYILLENDSVFAEYQSHQPGRSDTGQSSQAEPQAGRIHLARNILVNRQHVGTIHLDANQDKIDARIEVFSIVLFVAIFIAMLLARLISRQLNRYITEPLGYLESLLTRITRNHSYSDRSVIQTNDEIGALSVGINNMLENITLRDQKLHEELEQRKHIEKKLDLLAYFDHQTTLPNRHAFTEHINRIMHDCASNGRHFYLLMLDLDDFKVVNDTIGHAGGDKLLKECGKRLRSILSKKDGIFRIGGDEFAITLQDIGSTDDVEKICNRITRAVSQKFMIDKHEIFVGTSIGVVQYIDDNFSASSLIKNADAAMYWAKSDGKNTFKLYSQEIEDLNYQQQQLITYLQDALSNNELELYYQPIVNVGSGLIVGVEALLRWHQPNIGVVSPIVFIPIAESTGLITPIGDWVINTALAQIKVWQDKYRPDLFVNINISGRQFQDQYIVDKINTAISRNMIDPRTINFELTESILMEDVETTIQILQSLRKIGTSISVDDFGTGHSSMNYLKQFPVNTLKIDKSFVHGLPDDEVDIAIIKSIFALAKSLKLDVVAEGVETEQQLDFLRKNNCAKAQGYFFSPPVPANQIEELFEEFNAAIHLGVQEKNNTRYP